MWRNFRIDKNLLEVGLSPFSRFCPFRPKACITLPPIHIQMKMPQNIENTRGKIRLHRIGILYVVLLKTLHYLSSQTFQTG